MEALIIDYFNKQGIDFVTVVHPILLVNQQKWHLQFKTVMMRENKYFMLKFWILSELKQVFTWIDFTFIRI